MKLVNLIFIAISAVSTNQAFAQGIDLDGHVTVERGFCGNNLLYTPPGVLEFATEEAREILMVKAQRECGNVGKAMLTNNVGEEKIRTSIAEIKIVGCVDKKAPSLLVRASSGFICVD